MRGLLVWLVTGLAALVLLGPGALRAGRVNSANVLLVRAVCTPEPTPQCPVPPELPWALATRTPLPRSWQEGVALTPCQALWASRLATEPERAWVLLDTSAPCPRPLLRAGWGAALAWAQGDEAEAARWWAKLPATALVQLGRQALLAGDRERGRRQLMLAADRLAAEPLPRGDLVQLFLAMGDEARAAGRHAEALDLYQRAWRLSPDGTNIGFFYHVGTALRETGQPAEARRILLAGLPYLQPEWFLFNAQYYIQLGQSELALENPAAALAAYAEAERWFQQAPVADTAQQRYLQDLIALARRASEAAP